MTFKEIYNTINESEGRVLPVLRGIHFDANEYADLLDLCLYWVDSWNEKTVNNDISIKLYHWIMNELRTRKKQHKFTENMELNLRVGRPDKEKKIALQIIQVQTDFKPIMKEIRFELNRAIEKHPNYPTNRFEQVCILQEEVGEVTKSVLQLEQEAKGSLQDIKAELIQSAAMCIRMLMNL